MRGADNYNEALLTTVKLEDFVPANHPLRPIRTWVNDALASMDAKFSAMYEADAAHLGANASAVRAMSGEKTEMTTSNRLNDDAKAHLRSFLSFCYVQQAV